jgi:hypothetical protein
VIAQTAALPAMPEPRTAGAGDDQPASAPVDGPAGGEPGGPAEGVRICPLVLLFAATAVGIAADRVLAPLETARWIVLAMTAASLSCVLSGFRRLSGLLLLGATAALAAGWHHFWWNDHPVDDLAAVMTERPTPAWLRGNGRDSPPTIRPGSALGL